MKTEIVKHEVPFFGDKIEALVGPSGEPRVGVKRICKNIPVNFQTQLRALTTTHAHWAGVVIMTTPDERGRPQELATIGIDRLPMWMANINVSKIGVDARPRLVRYQCKAADVLADYFLGGNAAKLSGVVRQFEGRIIALETQIQQQGGVTILEDYLRDKRIILSKRRMASYRIVIAADYRSRHPREAIPKRYTPSTPFGSNIYPIAHLDRFEPAMRRDFEDAKLTLVGLAMQ